MERKYKIGNILLALLKSFAYLAVFIVISTAVIDIYSTIESIRNGGVISREDILSKTYQLTLVSNVVLIILFALFFRIISRDFFERIKFNPLNRKSIPYTLALGFCAQFAVLFIIVMIPFPEKWYEMLSSDVPTSMIVKIISVGIVGPIAEEVVFRGLIFGTLRKSMPKWIAIIVSSAIFGAMHSGPIGFIYATAMGIIMAWIFDKFNSIFASAIFHMTYNLSSVLMSNGVPIFVCIISIPLTVYAIVMLSRFNDEVEK